MHTTRPKFELLNTVFAPHEGGMLVASCTVWDDNAGDSREVQVAFASTPWGLVATEGDDWLIGQIANWAQAEWERQTSEEDPS